MRNLWDIKHDNSINKIIIYLNLYIAVGITVEGWGAPSYLSIDSCEDFRLVVFVQDLTGALIAAAPSLQTLGLAFDSDIRALAFLANDLIGYKLKHLSALTLVMVGLSFLKFVLDMMSYIK